jgi:pullulanase
MPSPTPTLAPQPSATPAPRPDPLAWLIEHKERWPKEVTLREVVEFPAVLDGKVVGTVKVPAGTPVQMVEITGREVAVVHMGGGCRVAITATDLPARAEAALAKAEAEARQAALATPPPAGEMEEPEKPAGDEINIGLGALPTRRATTFRIFAPTAKSVSVVLYDEPSGDKGRRVRALRQQPNGLWDATVDGDLRGKFYTCLLTGEDPKSAREMLDPYAVNAVASSTRARITPMTDAVPAGPRVESPTDMVIYEMHVRDFTIAPSSGVKHAGLYLGWTEQGTRLPGDDRIRTALDHLTELGVTHVQLMPVEDFENDEAHPGYNWGYITSAFFSPEGMFATNPDDDSRVRELKALITALHSRGIGVIMDVVYNHTSGKAPLLSIAPQQYYRHLPDGSLANGSACGNEFRSESPMARKLILDSLKFWVREYGVDGFRFDLMALIDQKTMRQAERELRAINPGIVLYGEPWTGGASPLAKKSDKEALRALEPVGAFNDDFRNALKGLPDGSAPGWIQDGSQRDALKAAMLVSSWLASPAQSINYMTCHDNLVLWDKLKLSMPNADDELCEQTMKLGYLALLTSQGVPFIHGGEEFARTKGGNNNSYDAPDSVNQVDWELKKQHLGLFTYVRDLIALRKAHPLFRLRTCGQVASRVKFKDPRNDRTLLFTVNGDGVPGETWRRACVVLNSSDETGAAITLPSGTWTLALDADGVAKPDSVSGKVTVPKKSGLVLYQR